MSSAHAREAFRRLLIALAHWLRSDHGSDASEASMETQWEASDV